MMEKQIKILAIIPARGGSKGIPKKNVRFIHGKPLISYSIINALKSKYILDVVVSTDDDEVKRVSRKYGVEVIERPANLATDIVTLDPVVHHATIEMENKKQIKYDVIITMQPTSPLLTVQTLDNSIEYFIQEKFDSVISVVNNPHLAWTQKDNKCLPLYKERLNRQYLPSHFIETGAFLITKREFVSEYSRIGVKIGVFEISKKEAVDIDTPQDWWIAEKELSKKNIIFRTDGYSEIGMGHIYRCLLLANNFIEHDIKFVISERSDLGIEKIQKSYFKFDVIKDNSEFFDIIKKDNCDIIVNDILDTDESYICKLKELGVRVINFEDLGTGANYADAVINDLYEKQRDGHNYFWGSKYYCIRDEFLLAKPKPFEEKVKEILILFGGTDPSNLTQKVLKVVIKLPPNLDIKYTFILGMGYKKVKEIKDIVKKSNLNIEIIQNVNLMTEYMGRADIAISSQGRTMLELATMAVPTILLAQNNRELHHEFGYLKNGFINLGLGVEVKEKTIYETLLWLINSPQIRLQIRKQMLAKDLKNGLHRVKKIILGNETDF